MWRMNTPAGLSHFAWGIAMAAMLTIGMPNAARAQTGATPPSSAPAADSALLSDAQLDQLTAPIALYPDPVLTQILMAATYPLEVAEAARWMRNPANAALAGEAFMALLEQQPWDPSIKALVALPQVLSLMDGNLEWTEHLGDAVLAQQADVMASVLRLRERAEGAGSLTSTPQQSVTAASPEPQSSGPQDQAPPAAAGVPQPIVIEPVQPQVVFVPVYNPWCVYGVWPYPAYPPVTFGAWSGYCVPAASVIAFGPGAYWPVGIYGWAIFDWPFFAIRIDHHRSHRFDHDHDQNGRTVWQHDPAHRRGVVYRNLAVAQRFGVAAAQARRQFQASRPAAAAPGPSPRPQVALVPRPPASALAPGLRPFAAAPVPQRLAAPRVAPPMFESFGQGSRIGREAARGAYSRAAAAPAVRAAPPPAAEGGGGTLKPLH